ncbi:hypothetical protein [Nonomuraea turcica]|nr:hypothetical protein [Nonomuraea sp. G32]MDP4510225.1 hypothetical protein [Nonomuraea sp. G32]
MTVLDWVLLAIAACLIGFAKTAVGGVASLAIAVFAVVSLRASRPGPC